MAAPIPISIKTINIDNMHKKNKKIYNFEKKEKKGLFAKF